MISGFIPLYRWEGEKGGADKGHLCGREDGSRSRASSAAPKLSVCLFILLVSKVQYLGVIFDSCNKNMVEFMKSALVSWAPLNAVMF